MIQFGEDKYIDTLKEMWKHCFPADSDDFIRFFFDEIYKNEETLIYFSGEKKPVASLQMIPYQIKTGDAIHWGGYISGAMTHPDFRRKGCMEKLLNAAFGVMQEKGYDYTFLIPQEEWLFRFYEKYGYKRLSPEREEKILQERTPQAPLPVEKPVAEIEEKYYGTYSAFLREKENAVLKTRQQFACILRDFFDENGLFFANDAGMAFTLKEGKKIILKEFFYPNEESKKAFLKTIRQQYLLDEIIFPDESKGMIKKLNPSAKEITSLYMGMMLD
jgi:GNAT superfamily N-acetyltransferase